MAAIISVSVTTAIVSVPIVHILAAASLVIAVAVVIIVAVPVPVAASTAIGILVTAPSRWSTVVVFGVVVVVVVSSASGLLVSEWSVRAWAAWFGVTAPHWNRFWAIFNWRAATASPASWRVLVIIIVILVPSTARWLLITVAVITSISASARRSRRIRWRPFVIAVFRTPWRAILLIRIPIVSEPLLSALTVLVVTSRRLVSAKSLALLAFIPVTPISELLVLASVLAL
jgi:hypothetical protein